MLKIQDTEDTCWAIAPLRLSNASVTCLSGGESKTNLAIANPQAAAKQPLPEPGSIYWPPAIARFCPSLMAKATRPL
ncbi:MAG: hypothetical protein WBG38_08830 [Nodosilinea sp.]